jgi:hypothetical protein
MAEVERIRILTLLADRMEMGLGPWLAGELLARASAAAAASADWHQLTREVTRAEDPAWRTALVEMLGEVVLADGVVHDYEASPMRDRDGACAAAGAGTDERVVRAGLPCNRHTVAVAQARRRKA